MFRAWSVAAASVLLLCGCGSEPERGKPIGNATERAAGPNAAAQPSMGGANAPTAVELDAITLTAPEGWGRKPTSSGFLLAEFTLPRANDDDWDGRLTVSSAGGDIEANIDRWRGQFGGKPSNETRRKIETEGLEITIVDLSGEYSDQRGPLAPATNRPGARMLAAIIPVSSQLYFVKAVGPEKTIAAQTENFDRFVRSVKKR